MITGHGILPILEKHRRHFHPIVPFKKEKDHIAPLDLSKHNTSFTVAIFIDTTRFSDYINEKRKEANATYLIGGYKEVREMYNRSNLFNNEQPRNLHLGIDIWGDAGTNVYAPLGGIVDS